MASLTPPAESQPSHPRISAASTTAAAEEVIYECIWSMSCADGRGVSVVLAVNDSGVFQAQARGSISAQERRIGYPVAKGVLEDALVAVYVAEATFA